jgi:hypothetical protein
MVSTGSNSLDFLRLLLKYAGTFYWRPREYKSSGNRHEPRLQRIEAHICITFCANKIYKELERQLKVKEAQISPEKQ